MTVKTTDASIHIYSRWKSIPWKAVEKDVKRLQSRIAKAVSEKKYRKAKSLQWLLTHSYHGKLLAVRRVTTNRGKNTPGVDGVVWRTGRHKSLLRRNQPKMDTGQHIVGQKSPGKMAESWLHRGKDRLCMLRYQTVCSRNGDSCTSFRNIGKPVGLQLGKIRMYST